ncbi:MAG: hypothetical protein IIA48_04080 [Bacteroidetes bacterium]|nr:hypothetical protein [Bacteroidota bacterium]
MYDTLGLYIENRNSLNCLSLLSNQTETVITETGEVINRGNLKNLRIKVRGEALSIQGSLPKFYLGNNLQLLTRKDTQLAIEELSDELYLPIKESRVFRFDIGATFMMNESLQSYYSCLGNHPRLKRSEIANNKSLLYKSCNKSLLFYDKGKELKRTGYKIQEPYNRKLLLRYEMQFTKKIPYSFKIQELKAENLFNENFYINAINKWHSYYNAIHKNKRLKFNSEVIKMLNVKTLRKHLELIGLKSIGEDEFLQMLENSRDKFSRLQLSRLKRNIKELSHQPELTEDNESIKELDSKVLRMAKYYR